MGRWARARTHVCLCVDASVTGVMASDDNKMIKIKSREIKIRVIFNLKNIKTTVDQN